MITIGALLSLSLVAGCRNKIGAFEICVTQEFLGFSCANQATPDGKNGYDRKYKAGMICVEPDVFNKIIDEISKRDSEIARYKYKR